MTGLSTAAIEWGQKRGLSASTLETLGVVSGTTAIGERQCEVIAFPYKRGRDVVNVKYRTIEGKDWKQQKDPELRFWNLDAVIRSSEDETIIVEGEADVCALVEAGVPVGQVISVPNGAPKRSAENPEEQDRYRYVEAGLKEGLARKKRFILAGDNDAPGLALRHDLVRLLGPARCWFVDWPMGVKDANDYLMRFGADDLRMYITEAAREWPVEGLFRLSEIPERAPLEVWRPGFPEWESKLGFAPRTISVVTGYPGHGKTQVMMQLWYQICRDYGVSAAIASFETGPKPHHRRNLRQFMFCRPQAQLGEKEIETADRWIDDHFFWLVPTKKPSLKWALDLFEVAAVRHGAKVGQIDPWNKLEGDRPQGMSETDYIGQCLDECLVFAQDMNMHLQIVAHPAKPDFKQRKEAPQLYDISGSQHWANKVDIGLSIHRPTLFEGGTQNTEATLYVLKAKYEELGYPCKLHLDYRLSERRYHAVDYKVGAG
jgi:twinkle protein